MITFQQWKERIAKMKDNVYFQGQLLRRDDPRLEDWGLNTIKATYDVAHDPEWAGIATATSHLSGQTINRFNHVMQSVEDLLLKQKMTRLECHRVGGCIQRCMGIDAVNAASIFTWEVDQAKGTEYHKNFLKYLKYFQDNDVMATCAQTDVKGDRLKRPHQQADPDMYLRIVEKKSDGIVVRGCKHCITTAPYAEEFIVVPTRVMTPEDKDYAVSFAIPADWEGVSIIASVGGPHRRRRLDAPISHNGWGHGQIVFDDVFVPWERVFLAGEHEFGGRAALLFALMHRHSYSGCKPAMSEVFLSAAAWAAHCNGLLKNATARHKLAEFVFLAELGYAGGIAAAYTAKKCGSGTMEPDVIYLNTARRLAGINIYHEYELLADLAGGLPAAMSSELDYGDEKVGPFLQKYVIRNPEVSAEETERCFRMVEDVLCSEWAAKWGVAGLHGGGSPQMEVIAILSNYDMEQKLNLARYLGGMQPAPKPSSLDRQVNIP